MRLLQWSILSLWLVAPILGVDAQPCEIQKLISSDGAAGDELAVSVDIDGDVAVVGARWDDDLGAFSGSAYVFRLEGVSWVEETKLTASDGAPLDLFGSSVSVSGDVIVVGAWQHDPDGVTDGGSAYVFRRQGGDWVEEAKLTPADVADFDGFACSVAVDGDRIVAGSLFDDDYGEMSGSLYVFEYLGSAWVEESKLNAADGDELDLFGCAVALHGDVMVVGARDDDDGGDLSGSAYVFRDNGAFWAPEGKLQAADATPEDRFGSAVSVHDDMVVVGAPEVDGVGVDSGAAYLFRTAGGVWIQEQKLEASDAAAGDRFGFAVHHEEDTILVGAPWDADAGPGSGSAYLFRPAVMTWTEDAKLVASDAAPISVFGYSVGSSDGIAIVGAPDDDQSGTNAGAAYLFDLVCTPSPEFVRGDADGNGTFTGLVDAYFVLAYQFAGGPPPPCLDAADVDDNGSITGLVDAFVILLYQFVPGSPTPADPFPACGVDPTADALGCDVPPCP